MGGQGADCRGDHPAFDLAAGRGSAHLAFPETLRGNYMTNAAVHDKQWTRRISRLDGALAEVGRALGVLDGSVRASRPYPAGSPDPISSNDVHELSPTEARHAAGLMRVNHVGEICAQALYRGQATFCRDAGTRDVLLKAASEEVDHLVWCRRRLDELNSRSEEHTSELQSLMRISYAVFCLKKNKYQKMRPT